MGWNYSPHPHKLPPCCFAEFGRITMKLLQKFYHHYRYIHSVCWGPHCAEWLWPSVASSYESHWWCVQCDTLTLRWGQQQTDRDLHTSVTQLIPALETQVQSGVFRRIARAAPMRSSQLACTLHLIPKKKVRGQLVNGKDKVVLWALQNGWSTERAGCLLYTSALPTRRTV